MALFKKKNYIRINPNRGQLPTNEPVVPDNLWAKCPSCKRTLYTKEMGARKSVLTAGIISESVPGNGSLSRLMRKVLKNGTQI